MILNTKKFELKTSAITSQRRNQGPTHSKKTVMQHDVIPAQELIMVLQEWGLMLMKIENQLRRIIVMHKGSLASTSWEPGFCWRHVPLSHSCVRSGCCGWHNGILKWELDLENGTRFQIDVSGRDGRGMEIKPHLLEGDSNSWNTERGNSWAYFGHYLN